ncbi:MAG: aminotransferase class IV, partial [bacterium]|nr:aminotransferase class IV [bacterium]
MISYVNGEYVTKPVVSVFDRGFVIGDGVYDSARTFGGRIFKLDEHLERLSRSMRYIEIDPDPYASEIRRATEEVVARNMDDVLAVGDVWVIQFITRGLLEDAGEFGFGLEEEPPGASLPTIVVIVRPLNFKAFGLLYRDGVDLGVSLL